ncbi:MAG: cyclic nucleotide-binding domain-containing protein [Treponema sp.]|nr:cyclic nucleotide-binding domain-containing protein [Treponema sp.]
MTEAQEPRHITAGYIKNFFRLGASEQDAKVLALILKCLFRKVYPHNAVICRYGEDADRVYFIDSGTCSVLGADNDPVGEMEAGQYFGEYAVLSGEKRLATVVSRGEVTVYSLHKKYLLKLVSVFPRLYGIFLKRIYNQASEDYKKLTASLNSRRGLARRGRTRTSLPLLLLNYGLTALLFAAAFFVPPEWRAEPWVVSAPFVFLLLYIVVTGRILESLVLSTLLIHIILAGGGFVSAFYRGLAEAFDFQTVQTILLIAIMGALIRVLTASGSVNALRILVEKRVKTGPGVLLVSMLTMIVVFVDDLFSFLIAGACFRGPADSHRIPREKSAIIMGLFPAAACILNPFSIWGMYLLGLISPAAGGLEGGFSLFTASLPFNFTAILIVLFSFLLAVNKIPLWGSLKKAQQRVDAGGPLGPPNSSVYLDKTDQRGRLINLILPVLVLIFSSLGIETFTGGPVRINLNQGLLITLGFVFFLYCFQQYMTPEQFFNHLIYGIESMLVPMLLLIVITAFSRGMGGLGFYAWFGGMIRFLVGGQLWLVPCMLFILFTFMALFFGNAWAMYVIGIPMALQLASLLGGNPALYTGAVCAAGLAGGNLSMYVSDLFVIGSVIGIDPLAYYRAQFPYIAVIAVLSAAGYAAAGFFLGL